MILCPLKKTLEVNLRNHLASFEHQMAVENAQQPTREATRTSRPGRPSKSTATSSHSNQCDLYLWLKNAPSTSVEGIPPNVQYNVLTSLMCYGFRSPSVQYGKNSFLVNVLLDDPHFGVKWYPKPHLSAVVQVQGQMQNIRGAFQHRNCNRLSVTAEPFPNLTCPNYVLIPLQTDFRMRVRREDRALVKRGHCSTTLGIRLDYLSTVEISKHTRKLMKKFRLMKLEYWNARTRIVQLKTKRPTMRESTTYASSDNNLIKFCNNIISAHRIGAFGGERWLIGPHEGCCTKSE